MKADCSLDIEEGSADASWSTSSSSRRRATWVEPWCRLHVSQPPLTRLSLAQIEIWFGILQRRVLRLGDFRNPADLEKRLLGFVRHWNAREAHPFRWTFRGRFAEHQRPRLAA